MPKCEERAIDPFVVGAENGWPLAGWFDYLNLRLNGYDFHIALLNGEKSFLSSEVRRLFDSWKLLLEADCFNQDALEKKWREVLPYLYRKRAGMYLMGSFLVPATPQRVQADVAFRPFPILDATIPAAEDAPTDVLIVPSNAPNKKEAMELIRYFASAEVQTRINQNLNMLSPNMLAEAENSSVEYSGRQLLNQSKYLAQFFDRDAKNTFVRPSLTALKEFFLHRDVERVTAELENIRNAQQ